MALWTDADFVSTQDLTALDAEVPAVASAEDIRLEDTSGAGVGLIHRAIEEAGDTLMKYLQVFGGYLSSGSVSAAHQAAVMNVGLPSVNRSKILLGQVVVSGLHPLSWTPIKRWAAYLALTLFYRDVASRTQKDRYQNKFETFRSLANGRYWDDVRSVGVPIARSPLVAPGAAWEPGTGTWGDANVSQVAGAGTVTDNYDVVVTWVDQTPGRYVSQASKGNAESSPSTHANIALTSGNLLRVDIASLVPPTGKQNLATIPFAVVDYMQATGWNVYAGLTNGPLYLQTPTPIPIATKTWTATADPVTTTAQGSNGQYADLYMSMPSGGMIQRG